MSKWILPEDRLPKDGESVLVTISAGTEYAGSISRVDDVFMAVYAERDPDIWDDRNHFVLWDPEATNLTSEILAWMPMPEAYSPLEDK